VVNSAIVGVRGPDWTIAAVADFNGDDKADILWRHTSGTVAVWFMNGTSVVGVGVVGTPTTDWHIAGTIPPGSNP
jgi:hypothetical protein